VTKRKGLHLEINLGCCSALKIRNPNVAVGTVDPWGGTCSPRWGGGIVSSAKGCSKGGVWSCWYQVLGRNSPPQAQTGTPPARATDVQHPLLGKRTTESRILRVFYAIYFMSLS